MKLIKRVSLVLLICLSLSITAYCDGWDVQKTTTGTQALSNNHVFWCTTNTMFNGSTTNAMIVGGVTLNNCKATYTGFTSYTEDVNAYMYAERADGTRTDSYDLYMGTSTVMQTQWMKDICKASFTFMATKTTKNVASYWISPKVAPRTDTAYAVTINNPIHVGKLSGTYVHPNPSSSTFWYEFNTIASTCAAKLQYNVVSVSVTGNPKFTSHYSEYTGYGDTVAETGSITGITIAVAPPPTKSCVYGSCTLVNSTVEG